MSLLTLGQAKTAFLSLIEILECAVCLETLRAPTGICRNGHLFCQECKSRLKPNRCPLCRCMFNNKIQLQLIEEFLACLPRPCRNMENGCQALFKLDEESDHEQACLFRLVRCFLCEYKGHYHLLEDHVRNSHPADLWTKNTIKCSYNNDLSNLKHFKLLCLYGEAFWYHCESVRDMLVADIQFQGSKRVASKFQCVIQVLNLDRTKTTFPVTCITSGKSTPKASQKFYFSTKMVKTIEKKDNFILKIQLNKLK
uniref:RING-type E3 ubiquitin transferase n=1 Tax=Clastoptera arizonana TaxID=38151 RepID=A0A1B6C464_9HEMI